MVIDPEGFVYVTGSSVNGIVTLKYNASGKVLWTKLRSLPNNTVSLPNHLFRDDGGNLYIVSQVVKKPQSPSHELCAIQVLKYDSNGQLQWDHIYWETTKSFQCRSACIGGGIYITGTMGEGNYSYNTLFLLGIGTNGIIFAKKSFSGGSRGEQIGGDVVVDHRNLPHVTGLAHFADAEGPLGLLDSTEITTLTFQRDKLLRIQCYAGSEMLKSTGNQLICTDDQNNIFVAGQTFGGLGNDLVLIKYAP